MRYKHKFKRGDLIVTDVHGRMFYSRVVAVGADNRGPWGQEHYTLDQDGDVRKYDARRIDKNYDLSEGS